MIAPEPLFGDDFQRRLERLALVVRQRTAGGSAGRRRSKRRGSGVEFADRRAYQPGDDLRALDIGVYQRFGRLLLRLFEEESDLSLVLVLDCSASMTAEPVGGFDAARRLCAALAYLALAGLDRVAVVALQGRGAQVLSAGRGKPRFFEVLRFLGSLQAAGETQLAPAVRSGLRGSLGRGAAVLISDLYDPHGFRGGIDALRYARFETSVIQVVRPLDIELPGALLGDAVLTDCETGEEHALVVTEKVLEGARAALQSFRNDVRTYCMSRQVSYAAYDATAPFDDALLGLLGRGGLAL